MRSILLALAAGLLLGACGWHTGLGVPAGARTVSIEFAANETRLPDLEVDLTDALYRALLDRLDLAVVSYDEADLVLDARLVDLRRRGGVRDEDARLLEGGVILGVEVDLRDRRSGEVLETSRRRLSSGYVVGPGLSPATAPGEPLARTRVLHNLADGVVLDLFAPTNGNGAVPTGDGRPGATGYEREIDPLPPTNQGG
ncbi:hypothetical protein Pla163_26290 [Planctomycetes bacterium Pla163]|uniref:Uncharacterized protein n=1 Tax=Rohdeia mirabilis TaxID=2528008 RepID=A0A518D1Z5_9BACT|nr:hypothetical protein Pla163_26290 [Planctomycetes bacterium Pla163]